MRACWRLGAPSLVLLTWTGLPSLASAEPEHVRIQFSAPKKCPDGDAFIRALRQRTGRFQLGSGAEQIRVFVVTITGGDPPVSGRLEIQGPGMEVSLRSVSGKTCDEVMEALALMTALALDPNAPSAASATTASPPSPSSPGSASPALPAPAGASNRAPKPKAPEASPLPAPALAPLATKPATSPSSTGERQEPDALRAEATAPRSLPPPVVVSSPATMPNPDLSTGWKWAAGVHGGGSLHVSPTPGLGGLLFVEAAAPGGAVLAPVLRGGLFFNQSDVTVASGAGAGFEWAAAMVEGCPVRLIALDSRIGLYPCLAFHLGVLRGQGRNLDQTEKTTDLWADLGPVARIRVVVSAHLFLEAQGMLAFPLRRLSFDVQDRGPTQAPTTAFAVPLVGLLAGIGVGYAFK